MNDKLDSIGIVIPLANESKTTRELYKSICSSIASLQYKFTIYLVVDNASKDNTRSICEEISVKMIDLFFCGVKITRMQLMHIY